MTAVTPWALSGTYLEAFQETQGLLQAFPQLKGIISPTTVGVAAAGGPAGDGPRDGARA